MENNKCPHCGYCPACGRVNPQYIQYPYYQYPYYYTIGGQLQTQTFGNMSAQATSATNVLSMQAGEHKCR